MNMMYVLYYNSVSIDVEEAVLQQLKTQFYSWIMNSQEMKSILKYVLIHYTEMLFVNMTRIVSVIC